MCAWTSVEVWLCPCKGSIASVYNTKSSGISGVICYLTIASDLLRRLYRLVKAGNPNLYYRIRKKFRGGFNFVVFVDDKNPRNFFIKKAMIHEIYYTFYLEVRWRN